MSIATHTVPDPIWPREAKFWYNICWEARKRSYKKSWTTFLNSIQSVNNIIIAASFIGVSLIGTTSSQTSFVDLAVFFGSLAFIFAIISSVIVSGSLRLVDDIYDDYCTMDALWKFTNLGEIISGPAGHADAVPVPWVVPPQAIGRAPAPDRINGSHLQNEVIQMNDNLKKKRERHSQMYNTSLTFTGISLLLLCITLIFLAQAKINVITTLTTVLTIVLSVLGAGLFVMVFLYEEISKSLPKYYIKEFP